MAKISNYYGLVFVFLIMLSLNAVALVLVPNAQVTSLSQVANTPQGNSVYLWAQVKNTGNVNLDGRCYVYFYVTGPGTNGYVGSRVCTVNDYGTKTGNLVPGEQRWYRITWTPSYAGDYKYYAIVQNNGVMVSKWSASQSFTITAKVTGAEVTSLSAVRDTYQGTPVVLWAQVKNTGNTNLAENCFVRIHVSGPGISSIIGYKSCEINDLTGVTGPLKAGEKRWYSLAWTASNAGTYTYKAYVEYSGKASAWSGTQTFKILPKAASASVTQTKPIKSSFVGKKVYFTAEVQNTGNTDLGENCFVRFQLKGPGIDKYVGYRACNSNEYGTSTLGALKSGAKRLYTIEWTPTQVGQYQYKAIVEYQGNGISAWSAPQLFYANPATVKTTTTTTTTRKASTTTTKATTTTLSTGVKWDVYATFKTAKWKAYPLKIWGLDAVDGGKYYEKFTESDNSYRTYVRYCSFNGRYQEYPDTWHIERKYVSAGKYKVLVRGKSAADCDLGQPQNMGQIKLNPASGWKITAVNKCIVSEDTQSSNGEYIATWCMADKVNGVVTWKSGSTCTGCCACGEGALVDIEITVEK